jgi:hypothetical protein
MKTPYTSNPYLHVELDFKDVFMKLRCISEQANDEYVYRGMSNEEWEEATQRGYVQSDCRFAPYKHQEDISCFGNYENALYYATELPIEKPEHIDREWRSGTPRNQPYTGIVIEVPRGLVSDHRQDERVHKDEYWAFGPIPIDRITHVWEFIPNFSGSSVRFDKKQLK